MTGRAVPPARDGTKVLAVWTRRPLHPTSLTGRESARFATLTGRVQRQQWLISRHALRTLLGVLGLPADTTTYAFPHRRLSLSHVEGAAVAAGLAVPAGDVAGIGVDLETAREARAESARFFLDERERAWLDSVPESARAAEHVRLWTVKEALYKADPDNRHTVLRDYTTDDPAAGSGRARRRPPHDTAFGSTAFGYITGRFGDARLSVAAAFDRPSITPVRTVTVPSVTFDDVAHRISATLSVPVDTLTPETNLRDLAADSFLLVEMAVDLQEEFDAMFTQADLREVTTLGQLAGLVGAQP
ncbi:4'-phosphopantetheinyl transferase superfamily protein [Streptomyces sp. H10-C2]|uniref:4'-phosphopantetheinyl transferase superfamily protein n=1 Tax=unclassified Streptomyces TaxID=2593676 RepID=UPI0024BB96F6|nr:MULTISPECIES: 4'-phosphopantetheinyl transferase superfamily protein [unclassified Streptomyces]MDJ0345783.1 4'-phosphopantetheinyl transferase superfamily protein [Streptomyces sp. PH10-H1]MDJ0374673.1 4'-phosphopantetheinyl transferase superfamily protein [Streptomyces sp. H10-C2]